MSGRPRPVVIVPDDVQVYRASEVAAMINKPGASLRSVATELGMTHTKLWRRLRDAGYRVDERWTHE